MGKIDFLERGLRKLSPRLGKSDLMEHEAVLYARLSELLKIEDEWRKEVEVRLESFEQTIKNLEAKTSFDGGAASLAAGRHPTLSDYTREQRGVPPRSA